MICCLPLYTTQRLPAAQTCETMHASWILLFQTTAYSSCASPLQMLSQACPHHRRVTGELCVMRAAQSVCEHMLAASGNAPAHSQQDANILL